MAHRELLDGLKELSAEHLTRRPTVVSAQS